MRSPTETVPALLAAALAAGCAQVPTAPPPAPPPAPAVTAVAPAPVPPPLLVVAAAPASPADVLARRLIAFHERLRQMAPADLAREQTRLANPEDPAQTLEAALLLGQARAPGDLARAIALLDPLARDEAAHGPLARLLMARLADQRRLEELAERQATQLREQQRRLEQLGQQLEALRAIERSLGRPPAPPPR